MRSSPFVGMLYSYVVHEVHLRVAHCILHNVQVPKGLVTLFGAQTQKGSVGVSP